MNQHPGPQNLDLSIQKNGGEVWISCPTHGRMLVTWPEGSPPRLDLSQIRCPFCKGASPVHYEVRLRWVGVSIPPEWAASGWNYPRT